MNLELAAARDQALTVRCPYRRCLADIGQPCRRTDGHEFVSLPAHPARLTATGVELTPTTPDELADQPQRTWSPTDAIRDQR